MELGIRLKLNLEHDHEHSFCVTVDEKDVKDCDDIRHKMEVFGYTDPQMAQT